MHQRDSDYLHQMLGLASDQPLPPTLVKVYDDFERLKRPFVRQAASVDSLAFMVQLARMIDGPTFRVNLWDDDRTREPFDYTLWKWSDAEIGSAVHVSEPHKVERYGRLAKKPKDDVPSVCVAFGDDDGKYEHVLKAHVSFVECLQVEPETCPV